MKILAKTIKGKEFMYSRKAAVQIPESWNTSKLNAFIDGLNKHFGANENETYHPYNVDQYDNVYPEYKAAWRKGKATISRI